MQYALFDVGTEQQVLTGSVTGSTDQLRDMSHYIADQSFEKLTGIKGAFSTKMLYVTAERFSVDNTRYTLQRSDYDGARPVTLLQSRRAHRVAALLARWPPYRLCLLRTEAPAYLHPVRRYWPS